MWESPIKEYARKHPNCSLQEYCEYLDRIEKERIEKEKYKEEENNKLLKSFKEKCFRIEFNSEVIGYFKLNKDITVYRDSLTEDFYKIHISSNEVIMEFEKKRVINRLWLPGQSNEKCTIIPEETFNKIVNLYQEMCLTANKIKNLEL